MNTEPSRSARRLLDVCGGYSRRDVFANLRNPKIIRAGELRRLKICPLSLSGAARLSETANLATMNSM
jgi:hypothetical protein